MFDIIKAVIIGIVEGLTEFLPISSTGHIDLVNHVIKLSQSQDFINMFEYVIQFGAILAVILLYFNKLNPFSKPTAKARNATWQLYITIWRHNSRRLTNRDFSLRCHRIFLLSGNTDHGWRVDS